MLKRQNDYSIYDPMSRAKDDSDIASSRWRAWDERQTSNNDQGFSMSEEDTTAPTYAELMEQAHQAEMMAQAAREKAAELRVQAVAEMVADIKSAIEESGLPMDEILAGLGVGMAPAPAPKRARKSSGAPRKPRAVYVDDDTGQEYKGGKPPAWLTEAIEAKGVSGLVEYRERFMSLKDAA